ncbi:interferon-stimulated 20 kDa exonuclease-like 2 [Cricetulus griseus]|uniref:Interferon-stimulated 20 kDa exonuclease-like 2 n=1 Tax=Cricetulus griseus TaxID=10029 RepID=G3HG73_CRIGR|nr:interferon-stimulated 20 kDa exonuclease-like 2 [Cricetulus griseus]XP_027248870.1 interferon-stimulated 20 kDa exonuclease-like 2 [Cricetulus griseus]XP_027248871.1 interferon-stimulated 20 kDa exonuclease-like 2 [Cricetulus griseus]EGW07044.1 Interferon-stimulated 20 kDa exonuclease-like 2 [Cricetulus griseus]ERE87394.1 interferon-stimulated exonuclease-like 2-like protein [Cricetulus griseus]
MSTILLNLDFGEPPKKAFGGNAKHQRFVKKRRFLEQRGFLNKKNQPPSKVSKLHSEPPKKGQSSRVDDILNTLPCPKKKEAAASKRESEQSTDRKASLSWLTPAPSKKTNSVVAKIDLLGEFQSALPKIKSHPSHTQKGSKKKPLKKNAENSTQAHSESKGSKKPSQKSATQNSTQAHSENKGSKKKSLKNVAQNSTQACSEEKCLKISQNLPGKMVAVDCEMVGTGPKGRVSSLARCSIVNYNGDVLYDDYILPPCHIVDYRTRWSGIRKCHMVNATPFKIARSQILKILTGKIVVGHAIHNDYKALQYFHPKSLTRDTSQIPLLNRKADCPENVTLSLKHLTKKLLNRDIQAGKSGHSSVEDAQATMELYKLVEVEWEQHLAQNPPEN